MEICDLMTITQKLIEWTERGLLPDPVIRYGIRRLAQQRLDTLPLKNPKARDQYLESFINDLKSSPIALVPEKANEQHYEIPPQFFELVLGRHRKYSGCLWSEGVTDLDQAEVCALDETLRHAGISDGQSILELGCGWGSLSLYMARRFPNSRIVGISNSSSQRESILERAQAEGLKHLEIRTVDMNTFETEETFDRIVSVEMFEHMRNWPLLFKKIAGWLNPQGHFFMHVFCHRELPYFFTVQDDSDWMGSYFFSGGMMPSYDLAIAFESPLELVDRWQWNGRHYEKTANAWLSNMDRHRDQLWPILEATYGASETQAWWSRWRVFFMACAELFGYMNGEQWPVGHYLFQKGTTSS